MQAVDGCATRVHCGQSHKLVIDSIAGGPSPRATLLASGQSQVALAHRGLDRSVAAGRATPPGVPQHGTDALDGVDRIGPPARVDKAGARQATTLPRADRIVIASVLLDFLQQSLGWVGRLLMAGDRWLFVGWSNRRPAWDGSKGVTRSDALAIAALVVGLLSAAFTYTQASASQESTLASPPPA